MEKAKEAVNGTVEKVKNLVVSNASEDAVKDAAEEAQPKVVAVPVANEKK